jgi:hypothetical protein
MSPEWMIAMERVRPKASKCLADPLERAEWQGLEWAIRLFGRLTGNDSGLRKRDRAEVSDDRRRSGDARRRQVPAVSS